MTVNNISFGKIYKVNGTKNAASRACDIANGCYSSGSPEIDEKIKSAFDDVKQGKTLTFTVENRFNPQYTNLYILSGKEARSYRKKFNNMLNLLSANAHLERDCAFNNKNAAQRIREKFEDEILNSINDDVQTLNIEYDSKLRKITSFDILA